MVDIGRGLLEGLLSGSQRYLSEKEKQRAAMQRLLEQQAEQKAKREERLMKVLSDFDVAKEGEGFEASEYLPETFTKQTYLKRKPQTPLFGMMEGIMPIQPTQPQTVRMRAPDGSLEDVPLKNVPAAKADGYVEVE